MSYSSRFVVGGVVLLGALAACSDDSEKSGSGANGGSAGSSAGAAGTGGAAGAGGDAGSSAGTGGDSGGAAGAAGTPDGGGCIPHEDYSGTYYARSVLDDDLAAALRSIVASPACVKAEVTVDSGASTVTTTTEQFPPDGKEPLTFSGIANAGDDLIIALSTRELGLIEITIECDGSASAAMEAGPLTVNCFGTVMPDGGSLQCEVLAPPGPVGLADITISTDAPAAADCTAPMPTPGPDCAADLPVSPDVGGACTAGCQVDQGGACVDGECLAVCVDSQLGCSLHCQRDESCLPLEQGGSRVSIDIGGTSYPAGGCKLEAGPRQAYESCGAQRCDGFNCLGFAGLGSLGLCAPECFGSDSDCPPAPSGFTAVCTLTDATFRQFCGITCDPTRPEETCPPDFSCVPAGTTPTVPGLGLPILPVCLPVRE